MTIYLTGNSRDRTLVHLRRHASEHGMQHVFLPLEEILSQGEVEYSQLGSQMTFKLYDGAKWFEFTVEDNAFVRLHPSTVELGRSVSQRAKLELLEQIFTLSPATIINRPFREGGNSSKLLQQELIAKFGVSTPESMVTNVPNDAEAFADYHDWNVIVKGMSGAKVIVQKLSSHNVHDLAKVMALPVLMQRCIHGTDIRVHVVGNEVFAEEIVSDAVDYRFEKDLPRNFRPHELPKQIERFCIEFTALAGLILSGIDFKLTADGVYYCLECNPQPAFEGYDFRLGGCISRAICDQLLHTDRKNDAFEIPALIRYCN